MSEILAIAIPVYNNTYLLQQCLKSLQLQTLKIFDTYIYDDDSTEDYLPIINTHSNLNLKYNRNKKNLGALANMQFAYNELKDKYEFVMIMHEDDLLHTQFIEMVAKAILKNKKPSFVISNFICFNNNDDVINTAEKKFNNQNTEVINKQQLALLFLQLKPIAFGSVIYNTNVYKKMDFNFKHYEEFADRPFLLNELNDFSEVALINSPLYFYRDHGITDNRWKKLLPTHVFNLLKLYKDIILPTHFISPSIFKKYCMAFVFDAYRNVLLTGKKHSYIAYLYSAKKYGFFSFKYALLKNSIINKTGTYLKKIYN